MVVVVGMGQSGLAVSRLLASQGIEVFASDADPDPPLRDEFDSSDVAYETGGHSLDQFARAREIVLSPGVPIELDALREARQAGVGIVGELEVASRYLRGEIVAITGSNGKTTTTLLTASILKSGPRPVQIGGNIGIAASDLVETSTHDTINVLEVSSFQLDGILGFRPNVGALLNITPDHLDRYDDFAAYRMAKFRLFANQTGEDVAVINRDDPESFPLPVPIAARLRYFGRDKPGGLTARVSGEFLMIRSHRVMKVSESPLRGTHNIDNVLAAILIADAFGITPDDMAASIRSFRGVEHRLETVGTIDGVEFVNDSKATNVDSAVKAVEAFSAQLVLILGGRDKGTSLKPLVEVMDGRVRHVLTIGEAAPKFEQAIGGRLPTRRVRTMAEAVDSALAVAKPGDVVLLAPACSSFDMYTNYEQRGRDFRDAVRAHLTVARES